MLPFGICGFKMIKKYKFFCFATLLVCVSVHANNPEGTIDTKARKYALNVVYAHIGEKRDLNDSELIAVEQISKLYQDMQIKLTTKEAISPNNTKSSDFDGLANELVMLKSKLYEFFLDKNFGMTNDVQTQENNDETESFSEQ